jgi:hypothetical protein
MRMESAPSDRLLAIRHLAAWANRLQPQNDAVGSNPRVLMQLVGVAQRTGTQAIQNFQSVIRRSSETLSPLGEPVTALDFSEHRWVAGHREEAYSDWLQWILVQATPVEVLRVFDLDQPGMISACSECAVNVVRERCVLQGHEGSSGRLDLVIQLGDVALVVVEVKLTDAESADTEKGTGYRRSIEVDPNDKRRKEFVILVLDAADKDYCGFKPRLWSDVCIELRLMAVQLCKQTLYLRAAVILAFVSAVEQNLLNLRPKHRATDDEVTAALRLPPVTDHIARFLEVSEYGKKQSL